MSPMLFGDLPAPPQGREYWFDKSLEWGLREPLYPEFQREYDRRAQEAWDFWRGAL